MVPLELLMGSLEGYTRCISVEVSDILFKESVKEVKTVKSARTVNLQER